MTGEVELPEGVEMVMPGDKRADAGEVDCADSDGGGVAVAVREVGARSGPASSPESSNDFERKSGRAESRFLSGFEYQGQ